MADEDFNDDTVVETDVVDTPEPETKKPEPKADKTLPKGYMSREEWDASGRDPAEWRDPVEFRMRGELIKQKKEFEDRIKNLNSLHEAQISHMRAQLMSDRDSAIDIADKDAVRRIDAQIANLNQQEQIIKQNATQEQTKDPLEAQWEQENPWIYDEKDPRRSVAIAAYNSAIQSGKSIPEALSIVDDYIERKFAKPEKNHSPIVESNKGATSKPKDGMSWNDLSDADKRIFNATWPKTGNDANDKRNFLKAMADSKRA